MKKTMKLFALVTALAMTLVFAGGAAAESAAPSYSADELFSERDLEQEADLSEAETYELSDGQDLHLMEEGVYVLKGSAKNVTVYV